MQQSDAVSAGERIGAIDIIRGFALFGVLWINLYEHRGLVIPWNALDNLATAQWDVPIGTLSSWLMLGKAQALFSLLFGFGFANIISRLEARGMPAGRIFLRRIAVLLGFGLINAFLMWMGDILVAYSLMGFVLYFTRNWSTRSLLICGTALAVLGGPLLLLAEASIWHGMPPWLSLWDQGARIRHEVLLQSDYPAFLEAMVRASVVEWYSQPPYLEHLGQVLGRFMIGAAIFRLGWFSDIRGNLQHFRGVLRIALPSGIAISALAVANRAWGFGPEGMFEMIDQSGTLLQAMGYGAGIVLLHAGGHFRRLFAGLAAAGRMALTNYMMQSLFYVFALYGFGLGLMAWLGATLALGLALAFYAFQILFSLWWLARYRFGPLEWLWRGLTYGRRQPFRHANAA